MKTHVVDNMSRLGWFRFKSQRWLDMADYCAIAMAVSLPLSTSATGILIGLWLCCLIPTFRLEQVRQEMTTCEGGLPVLLFLVAIAGTLWADTSWGARAAGVRPFLKLLAIPLLFIQFQRSDRGRWIIDGLIAGCVLLLLGSLASIVLGRGLVTGKAPGVVAKDYISQSGFFVLGVFLLLELLLQAWQAKKTGRAIIYAGIISGFLIDINYIATSRTTLLVIPVLLFFFGLRRNWKIAVGACVAWTILFLAAWHSSSYLEHRLNSALSVELKDDQTNAISNRERIAYWKASIAAIEQSPLIGHGTGSIADMFRLYGGEVHDPDVRWVANPHNQTLFVAIQLGALGTIVLYAMWFAHGRMFYRTGLAGWFGLTVLIQHLVSSLFNSHLSDFTQGWTYVICVGVAGGMVKRQSDPNLVDERTIDQPRPAFASYP